jgi:hypothetical protein
VTGTQLVVCSCRAVDYIHHLTVVAKGWRCCPQGLSAAVLCNQCPNYSCSCCSSSIARLAAGSYMCRLVSPGGLTFLYRSEPRRVRAAFRSAGAMRTWPQRSAAAVTGSVPPASAEKTTQCPAHCYMPITLCREHNERCQLLPHCWSWLGVRAALDGREAKSAGLLACVRPLHRHKLTCNKSLVKERLQLVGSPFRLHVQGTASRGPSYCRDMADRCA